ncbi:hypothetical protein GC093_07765 [Paenibacillus sp. LMG 31456]|uniref:Uncharacterized protein n=1 Tax=Paenibacillus foliorum TaxID=2654974 RepID=A0A972GN81_9BACL|nr:hypothetical protein [Paenibacillus foliorum]NOU93125.1 hypothetical protein [Paenibacillus foliorum]
MNSIAEKLVHVVEAIGQKTHRASKEVKAEQVVAQIQELTWESKLRKISANMVYRSVTATDCRSGRQGQRFLNNNPKRVSVPDIHAIYKKLLP